MNDMEQKQNEELLSTLRESASILTACLRMDIEEMKDLINTSIEMRKSGTSGSVLPEFDRMFNLCMERINSTTVALSAACERLGIREEPAKE